MTDAVETMAYAKSGGLPWHGLGVPVSDEMTTDEMLVASGLDWTVSKRPLYFPKRVGEGEKTSLKIAPQEYALVRDSDETMLDTVGSNYKPVQNHEVFDFFKRFVKAGDMRMETAGSLRDGRFTWALAKLEASFNLGKDDVTNGYLLLSQPHQFGFSLTAALTPIRVVCWNTLTMALGSQLDGSRGWKNKGAFRMVHSREFNANVKAEAERALGLANDGMKAFGHTAEFLASVSASESDITDYFHAVLQIEREDDTEEAKAEAEQEESRNVKRFREALQSAPGQNTDAAVGTFWGAYNAVSYTVDHVMGRSNDTRLFSAWHGTGASLKRRALEVAASYAGAA